MIANYKEGDSITIGGVEYTILYFHKGTGVRPLTAKLRSKKGGIEIDILKSELKADEPKKEKIVKEVLGSVMDSGYKAEPKNNYLDAKPSEDAFKRKNKKKSIQ